MALEIELGAVTCGPLDAEAGKIQIACKFRNVHTARPDTNMERVGTCFFDEFAHRFVLFYRGKEGVVSDVLVVFLNAVDENLHWVICAACIFYSFDDFAYESGAVFEGLRPVFVVSFVAVARYEGLADVLACGVDFNAIETTIFEHACRLDCVRDEVLDFLGGHIHAIR